MQTAEKVNLLSPHILLNTYDMRNTLRNQYTVRVNVLDKTTRRERVQVKLHLGSRIKWNGRFKNRNNIQNVTNKPCTMHKENSPSVNKY